MAGKSVGFYINTRMKGNAMNERSVVLVGGDRAQSNAFKSLSGVLEARGVKVVSFLGHGKPIGVDPLEIEVAVKSAGVVVTGMSSFKPEALAEILALELAMRHKVPCGVFQDTYGVWNRELFRDLMPKVKFIITPDQEEGAAAKRQYLNLETVVVGNQDFDSYFFPRFTREQIRTWLGVDANTVVVLVSGVKSARVDRPMLKALVESNLDQVTGKKVIIIYSPHPSRKRPVFPEREFTGLRDSIQIRTIMKGSRFEGVKMTGNPLLPGADVVMTSVGNLLLGAACRRILPVAFINRFERERQLGMNGREVWRPLELGFCPIFDADDPTDSLEKTFRLSIGLVNGKLVYPLKYLEVAEQRFPVPEKPGLPNERMAKFLSQFVK